MSNTKIRIADRELIAAFAAAMDAGTPTDGKTLCVTLGRTNATNVARALTRAEKAGAIRLDPPGVDDGVRAELEAEITARASSAEAMPPALAASPDLATPGNVITVRLDQLAPSPFNPRKTFDAAEVETLADSIRAQGLLQAPLARPHPTETGKYEIAAGERRRRAMAILVEQGSGRAIGAFNPARVPVQIRDLSDADMIMIGIIENADRADPHPMEEAEAFVTLKNLLEAEGGDAGKQATKIIAERIGKTRRHVQLRIALAEGLIERARDGFARGKMSLAQARALAELPHATQTAMIDGILENWPRYATADNIRREAHAAGIPASKAKFTRAAYFAAVEAAGGDPEAAIAKIGEAEIYLIRPIAAQLQAEALDRIKAELEAKGRAFVTVTDYRSHFDYPDAEAEDPPEIVGALIEQRPDTLTITVHDRVKLNDRHARAVSASADKAAAAEADKAARTEAAAKAGIDHTPQPFPRKAWITAKQKKTDALQAGIADANPRIAVALLIIGLLDSGAIGGPQAVDGDVIMIGTRQRTGADREIGNNCHLATAIAPLAEAHPAAFHVSGRTVMITDAAAALTALIEYQPLSGLLSALVADRVGTWTASLVAGGNEGPGDGPLVCALARELDLYAADLAPDAAEAEAYFKQFSRGTIAMIAKRCGVDPASLPAGRGEAAAALAATTEGRGYEPLEFSFLPPEITTQAVDALLHGQAFPKGGAQ